MQTQQGWEQRILIVEDDASVRDSLAGLLADEGYIVETARNGQEALMALQHPPTPRLILLDLMMPVMDGPHFRAEQLRVPALSAIPTIVLSAARDGKERARGLAANGYLAKPIELDELLELVRRHV